MHKYIICHFICLVFLYGCAKQTSPTGGPKDEEPPKLVNSNPLDQSLNFKGNSITMVFDEFVKLNSPTQQILITPRLDQEISYQFRRNRVIIEFSEPLDPNTTYSFNFREAIQDITESNPAQVSLAFSTGDFLDSLRISGNVYDLLNSQPLANAVIALQEPGDTSYYFQTPPLYFTKSEKNGDFSFSNLKASNYIIYAFIDSNNDLKLQPSKEKHGFIPEPLELKFDTSKVYIPLIMNNTDSLKMVSARQSGLYFDINFNKYVLDYTVETANQHITYMLTDQNKVIRLFNISALEAPVAVHISAIDSLGLSVDANIDVSYEPTRREPIPLTMNAKNINIFKTNPEVKTEITFSKPIDRINPDSLYFFLDSLNIFSLNSQNYSFDPSRTRLEINYPLDKSLFATAAPVPGSAPSRRGSPGVSPHLYLGKGAFISVENDSTKQQKIQAKQYDEAALSILHIDVDVPYEYYIVELLNSTNEIVRRHTNEETSITYTNLIPGTYNIRILEDSNNDSFWEPGNIYWNVPPDDALYYFNSEGKKDIVLRANWEVGPERIAPVDNQAK